MVETTSIGRRRIGRHCAVLIGLWALVGLAQVLSPLLPPPEFFCYRAWECALGHDRPFIPWYVWRAPASGDLSHTAGAPQLNRFRAQTFTTDEYGFRDRVGQADRHPDVVIVGDSFAAGAAVSDGELLDAMIEKETGLVVYNLATLRLRNFYTDQRFLSRRTRPGARKLRAAQGRQAVDAAALRGPRGIRPQPAPRRTRPLEAGEREHELPQSAQLLRRARAEGLVVETPALRFSRTDRPLRSDQRVFVLRAERAATG
jgi:hypothetical protein